MNQVSDQQFFVCVCAIALSPMIPDLSYCLIYLSTNNSLSLLTLLFLYEKISCCIIIPRDELTMPLVVTTQSVYYLVLSLLFKVIMHQLYVLLKCCMFILYFLNPGIHITPIYLTCNFVILIFLSKCHFLKDPEKVNELCSSVQIKKNFQTLDCICILSIFLKVMELQLQSSNSCYMYKIIVLQLFIQHADCNL